MPLRGFHQPGIHGGIHVIIRIHKADVFTRRRIQPRIARGKGALVFLVNHPDAGVLFSPSAQHVRRIVRGAVVDADDFQVFPGLPDQAFQAFIQIRSNVVAGQNNGNSTIHREIGSIIQFFMGKTSGNHDS